MGFQQWCLIRTLARNWTKIAQVISGGNFRSCLTTNEVDCEINMFRHCFDVRLAASVDQHFKPPKADLIYFWISSLVNVVIIQKRK